MQNEETLVVKNPQMPNNEPTIKQVKKIANTTVPIKPSNSSLLPSYTTRPTPTEINPKKSGSGKQKVQYRGTREPVQRNPIVQKILKKHEKEHPSATLAGQFSDEITVDLKDPRADIIDPLYFKKLPKNVLVESRHVTGSLGARLVKPVNWEEVNIIREQPLTNLNDVNQRAFQDLTIEEQRKITTQIDEFRDPVETPWVMTERRQFKLPVRPLFSKSTLRAQGRLNNRYHRLFPEERPVELVRKSVAVADFVDNLFNVNRGK